MKIAVDVLSIRPDGSAGGATGFAIELIKGFATRQNVEVLVLCGEWNIKYLKKILPSTVKYKQVIGTRKYFGISRIDRVINKITRSFEKKDMLKDNNVDILFCPFSAATYKERKIPTVSTILDIQHEFYPQFFTPQELEHRRKFYRDIVKSVERVVCISDYTKKTFCEKYGFDEKRAQTIYIAIQNRFQNKDDGILQRLNISENKYIVYPANFWEHKNHKLLLNAFSMYAVENKDVKLVLTGNPLEQKKYYEDLIEQFGIREQVVITGYITNEELYGILDHAKGLIYPSLFEGFGIPVVEAMHLHKLIACSNLTSLPEIGCDSIYYFNPKKPDEIVAGIKYLFQSEVTDAIIKEYDAKLKMYETDKMVDAYLQAFKDTIADKESYVFGNSCDGIYEDGWSREQLNIQIHGKKGSILEIELTYPSFAGSKTSVIYQEDNYKSTYEAVADKKLTIREEIMDENAVVSVTVVKAWTPADKLKNEDTRRLGAMIHNVIVEEKDGTRTSWKEQ